MSPLSPCAGKVVSLLELLRFYADRFSQITKIIDSLLVGLAVERVAPRWMKWNVPFLSIGKAHRANFSEVREQLSAMKEILVDCDALVSIQHIDELLSRLDANRQIDDRDVMGLQDNIDRELKNILFFTVPFSRRQSFNQPTKDWEEIIKAFPDAQEDIEEMNKCFALSRYTAAVFHSLLVVEHGLIALGHHIGVTDPKLGWDATYRELDRMVRNRLAVPVSLDHNFLEQTKARLDSMKLAWRNKVNHATGRLMIEKTGFSDVSGEEVIIACRSFMRHLAEGLPKVD